VLHEAAQLSGLTVPNRSLRPGKRDGSRRNEFNMSDATSPLPPSAEFTRPSNRRAFNFWRWFWLSFLVISLAYAWYCFYVPSNSIAWADSYASAQEQAARSDKPMILFFTGEWCVPCRIMKREVWADDQVADSVNDGFVAVTIDMNDPSAVKTWSHYRVGSTPYTIITDSRGEILQQKEGGMGKADFLALLGKVK
jgi:thioredoxin 1